MTVNILIVDDEKYITVLLSRILSRHGYTCTTANNAEEARAYLKEQDFHLTLCDVVMPGESGIDKALEEIENNRNVLYDLHVVDACSTLFRYKAFQLPEGGAG
ncbi:MAG: response regulator [Syntrophales bacterium]